MSAWLRSLQGQVTLRLGLVFLVATAVGVAALLYEGTQIPDPNGGGDLAHELLREFIYDIAWIIPLFVAATLAVGVWSIRRALRPLRAVADQAAAIRPDATNVRLPVTGVPAEILPLVAAVNQAFDRLEHGFAVQRQFTAHAAHELRTPLAILTAGLEDLAHDEDVAKLQDDAARMNRLVDQLLRVARLDAVPLPAGTHIDLVVTSASVVEHLAPWAISHGRMLGFDPPANPVIVQADADAIADALRNLVENAVAFGPHGSEITVAVDQEGGVSVSDRGPGIPLADRARVFDRFWRGRQSRHTGAGLGLAIVAEIARAYGGSIEIHDQPGGGVRLRLAFRQVGAEPE